jgi:hypothetical protein
MVSIKKLREFLEETKTAITEINFQQLVVDDSELEKFMQERSDTDNVMLFGVVPDFQLRGQEDAVKWNNQLLFFIVKKSSSRDLTHEKYLEVFEDTQEVARKFVDKIITDKHNNNLMGCPFLQEIDESSVAVNPVWRKAQCNGWVIEFDLLSRV